MVNWVGVFFCIVEIIFDCWSDQNFNVVQVSCIYECLCIYDWFFVIIVMFECLRVVISCSDVLWIFIRNCIVMLCDYNVLCSSGIYDCSGSMLCSYDCGLSNSCNLWIYFMLCSSWSYDWGNSSSWSNCIYMLCFDCSNFFLRSYML